MPELLKQAGVHSHLVSDHPHYWEDGGDTYHTRYTTWEFFRGQEGDPWKGVVTPVPADGTPPTTTHHQDQVNRSYMPTEAEHSQTRTVNAIMDRRRRGAPPRAPAASPGPRPQLNLGPPFLRLPPGHPRQNSTI